MAFSWANSPSMDVPFSDKAMALRASPNGYPAVVIREDQMNAIGFDAFQHWFYRESEQIGVLTTGCGRLRGDTPLVLEIKEENKMDDKVKCLNPWDIQSCRQHEIEGSFPSLQAHQGGRYEGVCYAIEGNGARPSHLGDGYSDSGKMYTLNTIEHHGVCYTVDCRNDAVNEEVSGTIQANGNSLNYINPVCYGISSFESNSMLSDNPQSGIYEAKTSRTLDLNGGNPACNQGGIMVCEPKVTGALCANSHPGSYTGQDAFNDMLPVIKQEGGERKYRLRRLTPIECGRLQGFPDWWADGANGSDGAIYKMWGNGIALPCAADVIGRLAKELEAET